jgi:hypothetical protein
MSYGLPYHVPEGGGGCHREGKGGGEFSGLNDEPDTAPILDAMNNPQKSTSGDTESLKGPLPEFHFFYFT